ncbi:uncharacterized protein LOC103177604 [Callorhinchus milii]|uniref:uncharacterized protein LOC103177604 n=1 Tax=Callorhinchus milii TaxID=7868 RepID=UPI0004573D14|nr:uncharacterized protein LOC103177604 [Callorhinchus milii]|eukprot:gi/632949234/ref/XP_007890033.1/ PREDICTED: uncharacterized protein LOC103177604 [Callorhinchus milii]
MEDQPLLRRPLPPKCIPLSCSKEPCEPESTFTNMILKYFEPMLGTRKSFITDWEHFYKTKKLKSKKKRKTVLDEKPKHYISVFHKFFLSEQADPSIPEDDPRYYTPPKFTLDDFLLKSDSKALALKQPVTLTNPIYSTYNHHQLVNILIHDVLKSHQTEVNKVKLSIDYIPMPLIPIPERQLNLELAAVIKDYMRTHLTQEQEHFKSGIRKELTMEEKHLLQTFNNLPVYPGQDKIITPLIVTQRFYESQYSHTSFPKYKSIRKLSDSETAVQDSVKKGGFLLNLRLCQKEE